MEEVKIFWKYQEIDMPIPLHLHEVNSRSLFLLKIAMKICGRKLYGRINWSVSRKNGALHKKNLGNFNAKEQLFSGPRFLALSETSPEPVYDV